MDAQISNEVSATPEMDELCRLTRELDRAGEALMEAVDKLHAAVDAARTQRKLLHLDHIQRLAKIEGVAETIAAREIMSAITEFAVETRDADAADVKVAVSAHDVDAAMSMVRGIANLFDSATSRATCEAVEAAGEAQAALHRLQARHQEHAITNKEVRRRVWSLTSGHCIYCNVPLALEIEDHADYQRLFHVDHIVPRNHGGPDHISNYVPACGACNSAKRDLPVADFITLKHMKSGRLVLMRVLPQTGQPTEEEFKFAVRQFQKHGPAALIDEPQAAPSNDVAIADDGA